METISPLQHFDVAVIGGGPAGATAGRLLAEWGYRTAIVTGRPGRNPSLAESLPPSCRKIFAFLRILPEIDAAGFYRSSGNTVWWGKEEGRIERFPAAPDGWGYQVLRQKLDSLLLDLARRAGASILSQAMVRSVDRSDPELALLDIDFSDGHRQIISARFALDCSGRAGVIGRKGLRLRDPDLVTLALAGIWRSPSGWPLPDPSHTLVETFDDGWAWSVPISPEDRYVTVMIEGLEPETAQPERLSVRYLAEISKTTRLREALDRATLESHPWGVDASLYSSREFAGSQFLLVGDAGAFIDPLSSFGVKKALASAWVSAIVVNTCLQHPNRSDLAQSFFAAREKQVHDGYLRQAVRYFARAEKHHQTAFWKKRAGIRIDPKVWDPDEEELKNDPDVIRAFEGLKQRESVGFIVSPDLRFENRAGIADREIVLEESIVMPGMNPGIRFLGGVDLPALLRIVQDHCRIPDLYEAYNRREPPVILENFLGVLSVLVAKRILDIR